MNHEAAGLSPPAAPQPDAYADIYVRLDERKKISNAPRLTGTFNMWTISFAPIAFMPGLICILVSDYFHKRGNR
jgi:hypothetical protein